jgi:two-component system alkaline phosphatase synthesis response regulator PhoP
MKRVLIVEDEIFIQDILAEILTTECKFDEVVRANDGLEGYKLAMSEQFDLVCLDHMMPYLKGAELLIALREKLGPNKNSPIFMISAYIPEIPESIKSIENTFFLEKPLDIPRIIRYVKMSVK